MEESTPSNTGIALMWTSEMGKRNNTQFFTTNDTTATTATTSTTGAAGGLTGNTILSTTSLCKKVLEDWQASNLATCLVDNVMNQLKFELGTDGINEQLFNISSIDSTIVDNGVLSAIAEHGLRVPGETLILHPAPINNMFHKQMDTAYGRIHYSNDYLNKTFEETAVSAAIERKGLFLLPREAI